MSEQADTDLLRLWRSVAHETPGALIDRRILRHAHLAVRAKPGFWR